MTATRRWLCSRPTTSATGSSPFAKSTATATGRVTLENIYTGRNMTGVKPGDIRKLLVLEALPKPVNFSGTQEPLSMGGTFTLERIFGTDPADPCELDRRYWRSLWYHPVKKVAQP